jgi:hypothetical protein
MAFTRALGVNVSVFSLATITYIGDLYEASITLNTVTDESKAVKDKWSIPTAYKRNWSIDGTLACNTTVASPLANLISPGAAVAVAYTTSDGAYSGSALVTKFDHKITKGVQTWSVTLAGQGALTRVD